MLRSVTSAHKRLPLSGFLISKNYIYHSGHTHRVFMQVWRDVKHSTINHYSAYVSEGAIAFQLPLFRKAGNRWL